MEKTNLRGLFKLVNSTIKDERGEFVKFYSEDLFLDNNIDFKIKQINLSRTTHKGAIRGMHFQMPPYGEAKIVRCVRGKVFDVVIDLRKDSKTFLAHQTFELGEKCGFSLYIPAGCAHGFQVLEATAEMLYAHSEEYRPMSEGTLNPFDPRIGIEWPLNVAFISEKDKHAMFLKETFKGLAI